MNPAATISHRLKEIASSRELIYNLTIKELKVKYKTAALGFLWAVLNPLLLMSVLAVVFSFIAKVEVDNLPLFILCGLLPWFFFSSSANASATSIIDNANLIKKVYFPRQAIPLSVVLVNGFNYLLSLSLLFIFLLLFKFPRGAPLLLLPLVIFIQFIFVFGVSLIVSCLHVFYRDTKYIVEVLIFCWFYLTPIFYPANFVPENLYNLYMLNPMAGFVSVYRDILLYGNFPAIAVFLYILIFSFICLTAGIIAFSRYQGRFADYI